MITPQEGERWVGQVEGTVGLFDGHLHLRLDDEETWVPLDQVDDLRRGEPWFYPDGAVKRQLRGDAIAAVWDRGRWIELAGVAPVGSSYRVTFGNYEMYRTPERERASEPEAGLP